MDQFEFRLVHLALESQRDISDGDPSIGIDAVRLHDDLRLPLTAAPAKQIDLSRCDKDSGDGSFDVDTDGITVHVQGGDFWVTTAREKFDAASVSEISDPARGNTGDHFALFCAARVKNSPRRTACESHSPRMSTSKS